MSLVWCNGFDDQDSSRASFFGYYQFSTDTPYGTGYSLDRSPGPLGTIGAQYEVSVGQTYSIHFSVHARVTNASAAGDTSRFGFVNLRSGTTTRIGLGVAKNYVRLVIDGTTVATPLTSNANDWHHFEVFHTSSTAGTANTKVYRDGALIINEASASNTAIDNVYFTDAGQSDAADVNWDNFVLWTGDGSGLSGKAESELIVDTKVPESDGTHTSHTPSTGSTGYLTIDESPPSTADYIYSGTTDAKSTFGFGTISTGFGIYGVQQNTYWGKYDVGTLFARMMEIQGGTTSFDTTQTLTIDDMNTLSWVRPLAGASTWTSTRLNAAEWGVQVRGTTS